MSKIKNILSFAMRMEKDAGDFYTYYMDKAESASTKELFEELASIEKQHYEILKAKYDELGFQDPPISISWVVDNNFSSKDPHILATNSDFGGNAESDISDLSIIRMAYLIENDFALFYKKAIDTVDEPEAKEFFNILSGWENQHRDMFQKRYEILLQKHWSDISSVVFPDK